MKFVIIGKDGPEGHQKRPTHRPAHLQRLEALAAKGHLILAGPFTDQSGSLIIIEADSRAEAEAFVQNDPYIIHGVFQDVEIHPFQQVFPEELNT